MHRFHFTTRHLLCVLLIVAVVSALVHYACSAGPLQMLAAAILYVATLCGLISAWGFALPTGVYLMRHDNPLVRLLGLIVLVFFFFSPCLLLVVIAAMLR